MFGGWRLGSGRGPGTSSRKGLRGEFYEALDGLQYMRDRVLFRLLAFHGERRPEGGRRAEAVVGDHGDAFARTVPTSLDPASLLAALREEIDLYHRLADPLLERHGLETADARTVVLRASTSAWTGHRGRRETLSAMS